MKLLEIIKENYFKKLCKELFTPDTKVSGEVLDHYEWEMEEHGYSDNWYEEGAKVLGTDFKNLRLLSWEIEDSPEMDDKIRKLLSYIKHSKVRGEELELPGNFEDIFLYEIEGIKIIWAGEEDLPYSPAFAINPKDLK